MGIFGKKEVVEEKPAVDLEALLEEKKDLKQQIEGLKDEVAAVKRQNREEIAEMESKRKIEDEEIKHMVKIKEERLEIQHEKKVIELERQKEEAIGKVKDEYRDKLEARLQQEVKSMKEMYSEILARLPDVNVRMKGQV